MAPPSDRLLRMLKRNFNTIKNEIEALLKKKVTTEIMSKIEILNDGSLKRTWDKYEEAAMEFCLLVDEKSEEDLALEKKVLADQSELRLAFSDVQAVIKTVSIQLRGEELRQSIIPSANSTALERTASEQPKLKKIEIPEFDGDLCKFYNFKALFTNLVHNNSEFSNVQKLYYLKQALVGKAAIVLQDCDLAEDAYPEAWSYFLQRYESKRAIVRNFFVKLSNLQPIKSESGIREMLDQTMAIIRGLKVAGEQVNETFSRYISFVVTSKLDTATAKDWDNHTCESSTYPKFEDLFKFLQGRTFVIDERRSEKPKESKDGNNGRAQFPKKTFLASSSSNSKAKCPMCNSQHFLNQCESFKAINAHRRYDFVKQQQLCLVCFSKEHTASTSNSNFKCRCGKLHHNLLHFDFKSSSENAGGKAEKVVGTTVKKDADEVPSNEKEQQAKKVYTGVVQQIEPVEKVILLPSAIVRFTAGNANGTIRILLDSCAQATMVSDRLVKKFRLPTENASKGSVLGGVTPGFVSCDRFVRLTLISRTQCFSIDIEAEVVPPSSMNYQVYAEIAKKDMERLSKFQLADPALSKKPIRISDVDLILGAEYYGNCVCDKMSKLEGLFLNLSKFGWTVSGPVIKVQDSSAKFSGFTLKSIESDLKKYNSLEKSGSEKSEPKLEVKRFVQHFKETQAFAADGKFNLRMPLKLDKSKVKNNRRLALISLYRMEQRLDPALKAEYVKFMQEYFAMGHGSLAEPKDDCYLIPHRCVIREESTTTPVRVVFNASSHEKGQRSLNDALMVGPQLQRELFDILISVRSYCLVFTADIAKMYRMIWIDERDRDMQRILWRESPDEPVREYRLNTVTYGTASASFMATQCLEVVAQEIEKQYPDAARLIRENFYMDDLIAGGDDITQVKSNRKIIHNALSAHGFSLRKYSANVPELLSDVPTELIVNGSNVELAENVGMLGVVWSPQADGFCIKLNLKMDKLSPKVTKRLMMSLLARTFDPLGIVAPVCLRGKLMIQSLWRQGLDWDEPVPEEMANEFRIYLNELSKLENFKIDRYICRKGAKTQLIGFCDASARAYCAVIFSRVVEPGKDCACRLICAKTRVAPQKELTIPKMELSAAVLLSELMERVRKNLKVELVNCFLFTDATIVLCWLSQSPDEWKQFVSNHVEKIQKLVPYNHWFYVHTSKNPADLATRGLSVSEFLVSTEWIQGPGFLKEPEISSNPIPNMDVSQALEKRKVKVVSINQVVLCSDFIDRFSSYPRLLRVLAYALRFCYRTRNLEFYSNVTLSVLELDNALLFAIRIVQRVYFFEDIDRLANNLALKASSKLLSLTPFLDENFILRVGGRLKRSSFSDMKKHPVILHAKAYFVRVLLRWIHEKYFHANRKFMLGYLAARYWIVGGCSNSVKAVVRGCVTCARYKGETASQLMGQLPPFRVNVSRPFTHTGVDLAGPFQCKCVAHRATRYYKVYMAIFVCMTVKCVHIEMVTDLSTAKFVEAMQRFIARRGAPMKMYSDNGTNFVGTRNLIVFNQADVESFCSSEGISWSMIPARSPHFGGLWESAVRSAKYHIARVIDGAVLSYDEYCTLFTRVEAILNSRPICSSVSQGEDVITPAHFLIGQPLTSVPELEADKSPKSLPKRLAEINNRVRSFWRVWRSDYLNQLQRTYKWQRLQTNVKVGQIVLVKDEAAPCRWPMAVVEEVHPDSDGIVRVVGLRLAHSANLFKRSVVKLVLLPVDNVVESPSEPLKGSEGGIC